MKKAAAAALCIIGFLLADSNGYWYDLYPQQYYNQSGWMTNALREIHYRW